MSARIVEEVGFPAAYMGGHGTSMMHYAIPDNGVFTPTEMIEQAGRVAEAISIPLIFQTSFSACLAAKSPHGSGFSSNNRVTISESR